MSCLHFVRRFATLIIASLVVAIGAAPASSGWEYTRLADTTVIFSDLSYPPALNNQSEVAFFGRTTTGTSRLVRRGPDGFTTIAPFGIVAPSDAFPAINDNGYVSFRKSGNVGFYVGNGTSLTTIVAQGQLTSFGFTTVNNLNQVAFFGGFENEIGYYFGSGGPLTTVVDSSDGSFDGFGGTPSINNIGQVAFDCNDGIFRWESGELTPIATRPGWGFANSPALNDAGQVAFRGFHEGEGVWVGDGGPLTQIAHTSGIFSDFESLVDINNFGDVAFKATLDSGASGLFISNADGIKPIILLGSPLHGATVTGLEFSHGLNDAGEIAFQATLSDGRQGIFIASPEPATVIMLGIGMIIALSRRKTQCWR